MDALTFWRDYDSVNRARAKLKETKSIYEKVKEANQKLREEKQKNLIMLEEIKDKEKLVNYELNILNERLKDEIKSIPSIMRKEFIKTHTSCEICGATKNLHIHHVVPQRLFKKQNPDYLKRLCHKCHFKVHVELTTEILVLNNEIIEDIKRSCIDENRRTLQEVPHSRLQQLHEATEELGDTIKCE